MGWQVTTVNRTVLPAALLPTVKQHCRVDFAEDDTILTTYTGIAIAQLEKVWDLRIFGTDGNWTPPGAPPETPALDRWQTPITPVVSFTAADAEAADVKASFALDNGGSTGGPNYMMTADGSPFPAAITFGLKGGFATADELPPEALGAILQVTARLYEYRENIASYSVNLMPLWLNDLLVGLWQPRA